VIRQPQRFRIRRQGRFELALPPEERSLLASLPGQLVERLGSLSADEELPPALRRLFPVAHPRDAAAEAAYVEVSRADLAEHHREALELLGRTANATELTEDELVGWLAALNDLRLVLGTALDVQEDSELPDPDDPRFSEWLCYRYLTFLEGEVIDALAEVLPPPRPGADDEIPDDPWGEPPGDLRWDGTSAPEQP
jgi:hypothetical protein